MTRPPMSELAGDQNKYGAFDAVSSVPMHGACANCNKACGRTNRQRAQRAQILSHQSIDAIRAAMDASMTRLQQSLSSQMVLLTIRDPPAGPFLGLLGTVIGVMITFCSDRAVGGCERQCHPRPGTAAALRGDPWPDCPSRIPGAVSATTG